MARVLSVNGVDQQADVGVPAEGEAGATTHLVVAIVVFIVLAGIWACLWVPPSRGF